MARKCLVVYFDGRVNQIYSLGLQLNKVTSSDAKPHSLDLHISISVLVSSKNFNKRDDFNFDIKNY